MICRAVLGLAVALAVTAKSGAQFEDWEKSGAEYLVQLDRRLPKAKVDEILKRLQPLVTPQNQKPGQEWILPSEFRCGNVVDEKGNEVEPEPWPGLAPGVLDRVYHPFREARSLLQRGEVDGAIPLLETSVIEMNRLKQEKWAEPYKLLASAYIVRQRWTDAYAASGISLRTDSYVPWLKPMRRYCWAQMGRLTPELFAEAKSLYIVHAKQIDEPADLPFSPSNSRLMTAYAIAREVPGLLSYPAYCEMLAIDPSNVLALVNRIDILTQPQKYPIGGMTETRRWKQAIVDVKRAALLAKNADYSRSLARSVAILERQLALIRE